MSSSPPCVLWTAAAGAQTTPTATAQSSSPSTSQSSDTRPATTTFSVTPVCGSCQRLKCCRTASGRVSGYRRGTNYIQGYTNVADFAGTFASASAIGSRLFGSFLFDTRIDRDVRPLFVDDPSVGGIVDRYPRVNQTWTGRQPRRLLSRRQDQPALRVAPESGRARHARHCQAADRQVRRRRQHRQGRRARRLHREQGVAKVADVSRVTPATNMRGSPDGFTIPTGAFRWGAGVGLPSRSPLRLFGELNGLVPSGTSSSRSRPRDRGRGRRQLPALLSTIEKLTRATLGAHLAAQRDSSSARAELECADEGTRLAALQTPSRWRLLRLAGADWVSPRGAHVRTTTATTATTATATGSGQSPADGERAVQPVLGRSLGKTSTLTAIAQDPDGDPLTYRWSVPTGTLANPAERSDALDGAAAGRHRARDVTVTWPTGKEARRRQRSTSRSWRPPKQGLHLRGRALRLRPLLAAAGSDARARRGDRRPEGRPVAQRDGRRPHLQHRHGGIQPGAQRSTSQCRARLSGSRGVSDDRLRTVSYGEERPKYDNAREETRRLNRRAALVVNVK